MDFVVATESVRKHAFIPYLIGVSAVLATFALRYWAGDPLSGYPFLSFLPAVMLAAFLGGLRPGLLCALLSGLLVQTFFVGDSLWPTPETPAQWWGLGLFLLNTGVVVCLLEVIIRSFRNQVSLREQLQLANDELEDRVTARTSQLREEIDQRMAAEAHLRHLQKVETIGQLTGGIAHDFNNMLAIVIGNLDLARRRLQGQEDPRLVQSITNGDICGGFDLDGVQDHRGQSAAFCDCARLSPGKMVLNVQPSGSENNCASLGYRGDPRRFCIWADADEAGRCWVRYIRYRLGQWCFAGCCLAGDRSAYHLGGSRRVTDQSAAIDIECYLDSLHLDSDRFHGRPSHRKDRSSVSCSHCDRIAGLNNDDQLPNFHG